MYKNKYTKKTRAKNKYAKIFEYLSHHNLRNIFFSYLIK